MQPKIVFNILTIFPDAFPGYLGISNAGRALSKGLWNLNVVNIRNFAKDKYRTVDDTPYSGGSGMILKCDIVSDAIESIKNWQNSKMIYMSPRGKVFNQQMVSDFVNGFNLNFDSITILCGHFEGVDQRVIDYYRFEEISVGDYVLSGGEPAAIIFIDSIIRNIDGVLGNFQSVTEESFSNSLKGLLEYPQYTRPQIWRNLSVPDVLKNGNHKEIQKWKIEQAKKITIQNRPDLIKSFVFLLLTHIMQVLIVKEKK